jgi:hypothetical protein
LKLREVRAFVDARIADVMRLDGLTTGDPYETHVIREALARTFIAGARSGLQYFSDFVLNKAAGIQHCRVCKCTAFDCSQCVAKTGSPCHWVAADLCSACAPADADEFELKIGRAE